MKDPKEIVAVKCEGCFTEWYSPFYREPYEDNADYRKYYEENILDVQPVIGPSLGESEEEYVTDDLQCLAERMCCDAADWKGAVEEFRRTVETAMEFGVAYDLKMPKFGVGYTIRIVPYTREQMPKPNEESLKVYGPYADLMRERVAAI